MTIRGFAIVVAIAAAAITLYLLFTRVCGCAGGSGSEMLALAWFAVILMAGALIGYAPSGAAPTDPVPLASYETRQWRAMILLFVVIIAFALLALASIKLFTNGTFSKSAATAPISKSPTLKKPIVWAQLRPDENDQNGQLLARAIVPKKDRCPEAEFSGSQYWAGKRARLTERWDGADKDFPVKVCEIAYPGYLRAKIAGQDLKPRPADPNTVLVIGDTGCRLGAGNPPQVQDCNDGNKWPFRRLATAVAGLTHKPDLIVHVGDYHYREVPCPADKPGCKGSPHGFDWRVWHADFFEPAAAMLPVAPWVMVRGNHEGSTRAASGWQLLLSSRARDAVAPLMEEEPPYRLRFASLNMTVLDVANSQDLDAINRRGEKAGRWFDAALPAERRAGVQDWLLLHVPLWLAYNCGSKPLPDEPNADDRTPTCWSTETADEKAAQAARERQMTTSGLADEVGGSIGQLRKRATLRSNNSQPNFDLVLAGDTHMYQYFRPNDASYPAQLVAGMSGTELESEQAYGNALNQTVAATLSNIKGRLWMKRQFGYAMLSKTDGNWTSTFHDVNGNKIASCPLKAAASTDPLCY